MVGMAQNKLKKSDCLKKDSPTAGKTANEKKK
jgi:hypothetical protein